MRFIKLVELDNLIWILLKKKVDLDSIDWIMVGLLGCHAKR
jgi:hypothetical protein